MVCSKEDLNQIHFFSFFGAPFYFFPASFSVVAATWVFSAATATGA
jgi:hypothetical protein